MTKRDISKVTKKKTESQPKQEVEKKTNSPIVKSPELDLNQKFTVKSFADDIEKIKIEDEKLKQAKVEASLAEMLEDKKWMI